RWGYSTISRHLLVATPRYQVISRYSTRNCWCLCRSCYSTLRQMPTCIRCNGEADIGGNHVKAQGVCSKRGGGVPVQWACNDSVKKESRWRSCCLQVATTVSMRST